jgi:hypothetical protein
MTGSGKTGLCVTLLEEAAIDNIPAIVIDPKGDLGNLLLTFPDLSPSDFRPWVQEDDAVRKGLTPEEFAKSTSELWRKGLAEWDQDGARIRRFREAVDLAIYTPGSSAGLPLGVLRSFAAPSEAVRTDGDALRERVMAAVSGLLALLGLDADPIRSRDHILLANILNHAWCAGKDLDLASLIREIQKPPFEKIGVLELESFFPSKDRLDLSMSLNNLLASPGFSAWIEGEPLDIGRLLYTAEGRPRLSILSIAHLSDAERMFFVTILLNEVLAWMRAQPGTTSLRALLYMDEVFGFFPPTANPPSKTPMLTLLKQARAFGLGVVLATQNPVDLDYKGLSNAGTWFLGRLQTERDKARVLEGLEGASTAAGSAFDRQRMEAILAGLKSRVFLMNNVHDDQPALFHTRWALSYLRGPLTRNQIQTLMAERKSAAPPAVQARPAAAAAKQRQSLPGGEAPALGRPMVPPDVPESFIPAGRPAGSGERLVYRPRLLGAGRLHFVNARKGVDDHWKDIALLAPISEEGVSNPWEEATLMEDGKPQLLDKPDTDGQFSSLPAEATRAASYGQWEKTLKDHLYRKHATVLRECRALKAVSAPGESEAEFRIRLRQAAHEARDLEIEKLRKKYAPKLARLEERIRTAEERVSRESSQLSQQKTQAAISVGATLLGALFGRKVASAGSVGRATTAMRGMARASREKADVRRAQEKVKDLRRKLNELEEEFQEETARIQDTSDPESLELTEVTIRPRKSDIGVERVCLAWSPWLVDEEGIAEPAFP